MKMGWSCAECVSGGKLSMSEWMWCSCLFEQNLEVGGCGGLTAGCRVGGIEWSWSQRERGHFFGVSHRGERPGSLPAGLTALSRNVCDWRPGWGCALSCSLCKHSTEAKRRELSRGLWRGISTPSTRHVFWFSFRTVGDHTVPCVPVCVCVYLQVCSHQGIKNRKWEYLCLIFWVFVCSDMAFYLLYFFFFQNHIISLTARSHIAFI